MLSVTNLSKTYRKKTVFTPLTMTLQRGERLCVLGPSGSGKSTLLRLICGLERPDEGEIYLEGQLVSSSQVVVEPHLRSIGVVFQDAALWPHLTVAQNIRFGIQNLQKEEQEKRILSLLTAVGLDGFEKRLPGQLSGGEARRVALARALAKQPHWLLLDEPLTNLDADLRQSMLDLILQVTPADTGMLFITHDPWEAAQISTRYLHLPDSRLETLPA